MEYYFYTLGFILGLFIFSVLDMKSFLCAKHNKHINYLKCRKCRNWNCVRFHAYHDKDFLEFLESRENNADITNKKEMV